MKHMAVAIVDYIAQWRVERRLKTDRVMQLSTLRIYHQQKVTEPDRDLAELLKDEMAGVDY